MSALFRPQASAPASQFEMSRTPAHIAQNFASSKIIRMLHAAGGASPPGGPEKVIKGHQKSSKVIKSNQRRLTRARRWAPPAAPAPARAPAPGAASRAPG